MNLAIVGAGQGGANLIKAMRDIKGLEISLVVDRDMNAMGVQLAKEYGIACSTDMARIRDMHIDAIIEATGVPVVIESLNQLYGETHKIIQSDVAKIMMTIVDQQVELSEKLNKQMHAVTQMTTQFETELDRISETIDVLGHVSTQLNTSTQASNVYIEKSDNMISSVNKITNQIKILGLNANIEAARAGEHGRGFSVVASEVQKLSDETAKFAREISELLKSISFENSQITQEVQKLEELSHNQHSVSSNVQSSLAALIDQTSQV